MPRADWAWSTEIEVAQWWVERLEPWLDPGIRSIVPSGFEAVTRIFHPIEHPDGSTGSWSALAAANGREAHRRMQLHAIATPADQPVHFSNTNHDGPYVSIGDLPEPTQSTLAQVLTEATANPDRCWFGVWEGFGQLLDSPVHTFWNERLHRGREQLPGLAPPEIQSGPRIRAPSRSYLLLRGALGSLGAISDALGSQCPNLWWPEDRSWFLVTEIDFAWTYVAGPETLISAIERADGIEAMRSGLDHPATLDSDDRNR